MAASIPASPDLDLNTIPYDAPLSFPEPSAKWIHAQNSKGAKRTHATVPAADLRGKWVIISGANSGIGREAALQMAAWGANLILACRDPPAKEPHPSLVATECRAAARTAGHDKPQVEWWELDCARLASVDAFAARWLATGRPLDILCNNAGIGSSPGGGSDGRVFTTEDGFEIIHQVNFLSHVLLTLRLLPALARAPAPRVVCTTSCFHYLGRFDLSDFNGERNRPGPDGVQYYMNNKLYFQTWLAELQRRLLLHPQYRHLTVNGVHPGYVNSGIWNLNSERGWWLLKSLKVAAVKFLAWLLAIDARQGSMAILHGAVSVEAGPDPEVQGVGVAGGRGGGRYFNRVWEEEPMPHTKDQDCRLRVWRKVNEELKLEEKGLLDVLGAGM